LTTGAKLSLIAPSLPGTVRVVGTCGTISSWASRPWAILGAFHGEKASVPPTASTASAPPASISLRIDIKPTSSHSMQTPAFTGAPERQTPGIRHDNDVTPVTHFPAK